MFACVTAAIKNLSVEAVTGWKMERPNKVQKQLRNVEDSAVPKLTLYKEVQRYISFKRDSDIIVASCVFRCLWKKKLPKSVIEEGIIFGFFSTQGWGKLRTRVEF